MKVRAEGEVRGCLLICFPTFAATPCACLPLPVLVAILTWHRGQNLRSAEMSEACEGSTNFNLLVLPGEPPPATLPEEYAAKVANLRFLSIGRVEAILQQEVPWPEQNRTIRLVGVRCERPTRGTDPKPPLDPVSPGSVALGYELHHSANRKIGDRIELRGRDFTVARCEPARDKDDDRTAWISLNEAQELLGQKGLVNGIVLRNVRAVRDQLGRVRAEIAELLPGTRVIEFDSRTLAQAEARDREAAAIEAERAHRAETRSQWEVLVAGLASVVTGGAIWLGWLARRRSIARRASRRKPDVEV